MIKILHLYPQINIACGVSQSIYSIVTNTSDVYENYVFCLGGDGLEKYRKANIRIEVLSINRRGFLQSINVFVALLNFVKKNRIAILHSHHRYFDLLSFIISKIISVKTITSVHSKVNGKEIFSYKSPTLIACSHAIKNHLINSFGIEEHRIKVIHNFIDPSEIVIEMDKNNLKNQLGIDENSTIIGYIGRFSIKEKGVDILLESFKRLSKIKKKLMLMIIGDGEDKNYIEKFIAQNDLRAIVKNSREDIYDFYNILDLIVLPSRIEPFGIVAIEAGIMKKAFIGSKVDGLTEIIDDGINGILFSTENVEELTKSLARLVENLGLREEFGQKLYQKVKSNFTAQQIIPQYISVYKNL
jgi:glycosyltransferase involved in cell wall biosynthesis